MLTLMVDRFQLFYYWRPDAREKKKKSSIIHFTSEKMICAGEEAMYVGSPAGNT